MADEVDVVAVELRSQLQQPSVLARVTVAADEAARRTESYSGTGDRRELACRREVERAVVKYRRTKAIDNRPAVQAGSGTRAGTGEDRAAKPDRAAQRQARAADVL